MDYICCCLFLIKSFNRIFFLTDNLDGCHGNSSLLSFHFNQMILIDDNAAGFAAVVVVVFDQISLIKT